MDRLRSAALTKAISEQLMEQREAFEEELLSGCKEDDTYEKIYSKMILNGVIMSTRLAVGIVLDALIDYGIVEPLDDDSVRRNIISFIKK